MRFTITPCRMSFVLCALLALLTDTETASHIAIADPPELRSFAVPATLAI